MNHSPPRCRVSDNTEVNEMAWRLSYWQTTATKPSPALLLEVAVRREANARWDVSKPHRLFPGLTAVESVISHRQTITFVRRLNIESNSRA